MDDKKKLLIDYLDTNLFIPILYSSNASYQVKHDFQHTRDLLQTFSARGILNFVWNTLGHMEAKIIFSNRLIDEGFFDYDQILDTFKNEFTYDWLMS
ncbi:MAG: hypothetical protein E7231_13265 [Cellulosilyticum sp.]|nr:hypothetical protein [Cellulosilyticum sp.]